MKPPMSTRPPASADQVRKLMRCLGSARTPGRIYLVGGGSAVLVGWREATVAVTLKLDPEPAGVFEAIARAKDALNINVELAAPDDFIPELPGWRERSPFIDRYGRVDYHHYDFHAQALAKIERAHAVDSADVAAMAQRGLIRPGRLIELFEAVEPKLLRYPAVDPANFRCRVLRVASEIEADR